MIRRQPWFATIAILSLGLGIGLNAAVFAVVDAVVLRPPPIHDPASLVAVFTSHEHGEAYGTTSYPDFQDLAAGNETFAGIAARSMIFAAVALPPRATGAAPPANRLAMGEVVTASYFPLLGVTPALGRAFTPDEDRGEGAHAVVVISDRLWRQIYDGRPDVIGQTMTVRSRPYTIVGVAPASFTGLTPGLSAELWLPISMVEDVEPVGMNAVVPSPGTTRLTRRGTRWMFVVGRLRRGITAEVARQNLDAIMTRLGSEFPGSNAGRQMLVTPAAAIRVHPAIDGALRPTAAVLQGGVLLVLLVACANLSGMLFARGMARSKEMAVRAALGASRARIVWMLVAENMALAVVGGLVGLLFAVWTVGALAAMPLPVALPLSFAFAIDSRVVAFTAAISLITGLAASLPPAYRAGAASLIPALKFDAAGFGPGRRPTLGRSLVVVQVAVSIVLTTGGLLLTRSLFAANRLNPGFDISPLSVATVSLDFHGYSTERGRAFFDVATTRLGALPGVTAVGISNRLPFTPNIQTTSVVVDGRPDATPGDGLSVDNATVSDNYFDVMGLQLLEGRRFDSRDTPDGPLAVIVSQAMARRLWSSGTAIGQRLRLRDQQGPALAVVGVAADYAVRTLGEAPRPMIHFARSQRYSPYASMVVRASVDAGSLSGRIERELTALEPGLVLMESGPFRRSLEVSLLPVRAGAALIGGLAGLAMALAGLGLYGVIAFGVGRRTREIGIRVALGAGRRRILWDVSREGLVLVSIGSAVGLVLASAGTQALGGVLFGVAPLDPLSFGGAVAALFLAGGMASAVPARRAASIDPMVALRQ